MSLTVLVTLASLLSGMPCAAINNQSNTAAWKVPGKPATAATYRDRDRLVYTPAPSPKDNAGWYALHTVEKTLTAGKPGPKLHVSCAILRR